MFNREECCGGVVFPEQVARCVAHMKCICEDSGVQPSKFMSIYSSWSCSFSRSIASQRLMQPPSILHVFRIFPEVSQVYSPLLSLHKMETDSSSVQKPAGLCFLGYIQPLLPQLPIHCRTEQRIKSSRYINAKLTPMPPNTSNFSSDSPRVFIKNSESLG